MKDALLLVQKLVDEGLAFNQIERLFESQYRDCFSSMECKFCATIDWKIIKVIRT